MATDSTEREKIKKNVLIVDDHPFILVGYKNTLNRYIAEQYEFQFEEGKDCKSAYDIITNPETNLFDYLISLTSKNTG